jgi:hypothetical protein
VLRRYVNVASSKSGYSAKAVWTFYQPIRAEKPTPSLPLTNRTSLSCSFDPAADALVAVSVVVSNTTTQFPSSVQVIENMGSFDRDTTQSGCSGDAYNVEFDDIPPGGSGQDAYWRVIHGYYSPAKPKGDRGLLKDLRSVTQGENPPGIVGLGTPNALALPDRQTTH